MITFDNQNSFMEVIQPYILREARKAAETVIAEKVQSYKDELEKAIMKQMEEVALVITKSIKDTDMHVKFHWEPKK